MRGNSSGRAGGCRPRKRVAVEFLKDPEAWKRRVGYGRRWMVETAFSCIKRLFGEHVSAKKLVNMAQEMVLKASLHNLLTAMTQAI